MFYNSTDKPTGQQVYTHHEEEYPVGSRYVFMINEEDFNQNNVDQLDLHRMAEKFEARKLAFTETTIEGEQWLAEH